MKKRAQILENSSFEAYREVRRILGAPSLIADLAYVVAVGDKDMAKKFAIRIEEEGINITGMNKND